MKLENKINGSVIDVNNEHGNMLIEQGVWKVFIEKKEESIVVEQEKKSPGRPRKEK